MPLYADVVVPRHLSRSFTYLVPEALQRSLSVGDAVLVPFGPVTVRGLVIDLRSAIAGPSIPGKLRAILAMCREGPRSPVDGRLLEVSRWISDHYLAPLGQCLRLILPPLVGGGKTDRYVLSVKGQQSMAHEPSLADAERALLHALAGRAGGASFRWIETHIPGVSRSLLTTVVERGWVRVAHAGGRPAPPIPPAIPPPELFPTERLPTPAPWLAPLESNLSSRSFTPMLLEASAEGRLAAILAAAERTMAAERHAIILAPEVRRVAAIGAELRRRWGAAVELWHSERSMPDRAASWRRIRSGDVKVVVGTRAAVLAPLDRVGLLCVDEEDHAAYKEEQEPRYHAREVAWRRAELEQAVLLLLSNHASFESRTRLQRAGIELSAEGSRAGVPPVPPEVVTLSHPPHGPILSAELQTAVRQTIEAGRRVALYLNRRGYAPALLCAGCRAVPRCARCGVALTYSQEARRVRCRACGFQSPAPDRCEACQGAAFELIGCGTERLEAEVKQLFPAARVLRLDRDTSARVVRSRAPAPSIEDWQIVIGTKLMVRELPESACALVGIVYAEAGLHVPDFRASERTYHELSDVLRLADPTAGGRAIIQTCLPTHPVLLALVTGDRGLLDREESALREALEYPPFASMVALEIVGPRESDVREIAGEWAGLLQARIGIESGQLPGTRAVTVLGPAPGSAARARGRARWRLIVKGSDGEYVRALVRQTHEVLAPHAQRRRVRLSIDVDPVELA